MAFDHAKFLVRFVDEAREHCARISDGLLILEKNSSDAETLNALFRSAHTIKGSSRMMKILSVAEVAHHLEDVLDALRNGKIDLVPALSDLLFQTVDTLLAMLARIAADGQPGDAPGMLCDALSKAAHGEPGGGNSPEASGFAPPDPSLTREAAQKIHASVAEEGGIPFAGIEPLNTPLAAKTQQAEYYRINAVKLDDLIRLMNEIVSEQGRLRKHVGKLQEIGRSTSRYVDTLAEFSGKGGDIGGRLNKLLATGQSLQLGLRDVVGAVSDASLMQSHLVKDLQEASLALRMLPIDTVFDTLRRTVRDLAHEYGKDIDFIVDGGETELDRKIIEAIGDPLIHMIRNALDHGLEEKEVRMVAGKPPRGTIILSAYYDGGCVTIALKDDGGGISPDKIRKKASAKKLFDPETLAGMTRSELINLIFLPGFSTSPIITDLSGRGVGMDVVKKNIVDNLKGSILIESDEGKGTTFLLRLPLNLAVFPLVLVSVDGKVGAIPATSVAEMLTVASSELIEIVHKRAIRLREQIIPVEDLASILSLARQETVARPEKLLVILKDGEEKLGLFVDDILGREEMVVKPLPLHMQKLPMISGVTIGDGNSIINVFQVSELFRSARSLSSGDRKTPVSEAQSKTTILVVDDSYNTREIEKSILEAYGYAVCTAEDGEEAYGKTREELFDLVITDIEMPRLDGFTLTERLRGDERYRNVPIIIVTSLQKEEDRKRGITVGADAYIVKGAFDQSNLLDTVRNLIG